MTCAACEAAKADRHSGRYQADCPSCQVRGLAKSMGFYQSQRQGVLMRNYRRALHSMFKGDVARGHELVKAEAERLKALK